MQNIILLNRKFKLPIMDLRGPWKQIHVFCYKHDGYKHDEAHFGQILSMKLSMNPGSLFLGKHLSMNKAQNNNYIRFYTHFTCHFEKNSACGGHSGITILILNINFPAPEIFRAPELCRKVFIKFKDKFTGAGNCLLNLGNIVYHG